ncbi:MAG: spore coat U domain-containing protein [Rhodanobacter sp.]
MNLKTTLMAAALAAAGLTLATAQAATDTANMPVKITIQAACDIHTVGPTTLDFGTQGVLSAAVAGTSTLTVTCTSGAAYSMTLDGGHTANVAARTMINGANAVGYQLYSDLAHANVWGLVGNNAGQTGGTGNGSAQTYTVYGNVPAQTTPPAGVYNDTILVTVTY